LTYSASDDVRTLEPMLAKLAKQIPEGEGWVYEPKWDGFRALVYREPAGVEMISRDSKPLNRYLPEVVDSLASALSEDCVVDGEIVIATDDGFNFDLLTQRIHPAASRVKMLAETTPAGFIAFDLLSIGGRSLMGEPLSVRRAELLQLIPSEASGPKEVFDRLTTDPKSVFVTPQTRDVDEARPWLVGFEDKGLDGVVAKRVDGEYVPGRRVMVKIKHERTADCIVGGYRLHKSGDGVGSLLLALYDSEGALHYVGHTASFKASQRPDILALVKPYEGAGGFGAGRAPGGPSRWAHQKDHSFVPLAPTLVCEVAFDRMINRRFRHATRFVRWRPDKPPEACTFDQL
jgi:ATP-dependent DNA ligase